MLVVCQDPRPVSTRRTSAGENAGAPVMRKSSNANRRATRSYGRIEQVHHGTSGCERHPSGSAFEKSEQRGLFSGREE